MDNQNFENINNWRDWKNKKGILFPTLAVLIIVLTVYYVFKIADIARGWDEISDRTISFTETGEIFAKPDLALVSFSVVTEKKTVAEAMAENTKKMNAVLEAIKSEGVEPKDLKTVSFNIYPRYEYEVKQEIMIYPPTGKRILVGYEITQTLEVKIRNLEKAGIIIEKAVLTGANQAGDLQFTIDKEDELKNQAREEAIKKVKEKAKILSFQLGTRFSKIVNYSENEYFPRFYGMEKGIGGGAEPVPVLQIEPGENKISVTVTITYKID